MKIKIKIKILVICFALLCANAIPNVEAAIAVNYTTSASRVYKNGTEIKLKGINYFGFETSDLTIHGLWARNWKSMIQQIKTTGFNAVRLPFCPKTLRANPVSSIDYPKNPDLQEIGRAHV